MKHKSGRSLVNAILLVVTLTGWQAQANDSLSDRAPQIAIRFFNYAQIENRVLREAKRAAAEVFRRAGVETTWVNCTGRLHDSSAHPACRQKPGPVLLQLSILSREMARKSKLRGPRFGYSQTSKSGFGVIAAVFHHRVQELARMEGTSQAVILGHVMAHEVGHLLLGTGGHSSRGIMRPSWKGKELRSASKGNLSFTRQQGERIVTAAQLRVEEQARRKQRTKTAAQSALRDARHPDAATR